MRINNDSGLAPSATVVTLSISSLMMVWASNFVVGKFTLRYIPPLTLGSLRIVAGAAFMILLMPLFRRLPVFQEESRASCPSFTWRDYWTFAYLGFFGFAVNQICFTAGLHYTNVTHSSIIGVYWVESARGK